MLPYNSSGQMRLCNRLSSEFAIDLLFARVATSSSDSKATKDVVREEHCCVLMSPAERVVVGGNCKFRRLHAHFRIIAPRYPLIKARGIKQRTHGPNLIIILLGPQNQYLLVMKMIGRRRRSAVIIETSVCLYVCAPAG